MIAIQGNLENQLGSYFDERRSKFTYSYDDNYKIFPSHNAKPCNYFEQSTCVASLEHSFDVADLSAECLPACNHRSFHREGTSVSSFGKFLIKDCVYLVFTNW